jgi:hypothetical protein
MSGVAVRFPSAAVATLDSIRTDRCKCAATAAATSGIFSCQQVQQSCHILSIQATYDEIVDVVAENLKVGTIELAIELSRHDLACLQKLSIFQSCAFSAEKLMVLLHVAIHQFFALLIQVLPEI